METGKDRAAAGEGRAAQAQALAREGTGIQEIARRMGIRPSTVREYLSQERTVRLAPREHWSGPRALEALRERLSAPYEDERSREWIDRRVSGWAAGREREHGR